MPSCCASARYSGPGRKAKHAARDDRARPHGRQHGAASAARRARLRRLRRRAPRRSRASRAEGGATPATSLRRARREARAAAGDLADGAGGASSTRRSRAAPACSRRATSSIDGGNSHYRRRSRARRGAARAGGIHYVDVGTSGGVFGLERGYCLMIGGEPRRSRASSRSSRRSRPASDAAPRTAGRDGRAAAARERGYLHCGPHGAGHFVKMVHNGIEYGLMAAYAEGLEHAAPRRRGHAPSERRRRDERRSRIPSTTSTHFDLADDRRALAARQRDRLVAARSHRAARSRRTRRSRASTARVRLGRGALDDPGRDRRGRAGARCSRRRSSSASPRAAQADFAQPGALGAARRVRRPRQPKERR